MTPVAHARAAFDRRGRALCEREKEFKVLPDRVESVASGEDRPALQVRLRGHVQDFSQVLQSCILQSHRHAPRRLTATI